LHVRAGGDPDEAPLLQAARELEQRGATVARKSVDSTDAAAVILDTAAVLRPDLIAMTTHDLRARTLDPGQRGGAEHR